MALLGSVFIDVNSNFDLLYTTEAAYSELTSCKTLTLLQLVSKLQKTRHLFSKKVGNETAEASFPRMLFLIFDNHCDKLVGRSNDIGIPCSTEFPSFCKELVRSIQGFLNTSQDTNITSESGILAFSLAIERLLDVWCTVEDTLVKAKQNSNWRDVLSARLLVTFIELNHQLRDFGHMQTPTGFQFRWSYILSYLSFARVLTEKLNDCWLENIDHEINTTLDVQHSYIFDTSQWQISGTSTERLSGSHTGIQALTNTQQCLFDRAVLALRAGSRSISSGLSMRICLLAMACLIYPVVMFSFKQMTEWIQNYAHSLKEKTQDLKHQRQLAEDLLHQMLPKSVAKQLRQHKHVEAESYEKVGARGSYDYTRLYSEGLLVFKSPFKPDWTNGPAFLACHWKQIIHQNSFKINSPLETVYAVRFYCILCHFNLYIF